MSIRAETFLIASQFRHGNLKMKSVIIRFFICATMLALVAAQNVNVNCRFLTKNGEYACLTVEQIIPDDENVNFNIVGWHEAGRTNADVERVMLVFTSLSSVLHNISQCYRVHCNV